MARKNGKLLKKPFEFAALKAGKKAILKQGAQGDDVYALQTFLTQMGYLGRGKEPGTLCDCTSAALRYFQKCYGLEDSGEADEKTLQIIQRPRCGNPDIGPDPARASGPAPFVLRGCKYDSTDLTYAFLNGTPDLVDQREREIVRRAFAAWAEVTLLRFTEVAPQESSTFEISWERRDHGDGFPFDDAGINGNTLAHAFFPGECGGRLAGALHFDEFEPWTDAGSTGGIRLLNVAIHEIGHLLGLSHSNNRDAIMFAFYDPRVDSLRQDDIDGIQALYGQRPQGSVPIRGQLAKTGDQRTHRITAPRGRMTVTLFGPTGADFDLYVRAGLAPTRSTFDARGFTSSSNERVVLDVSGGDIHIMVDSWRGSGPYEVEVEFA